MNGIDILRQWVGESRRIVFFGGAGVSTESGIPDFRSEDGLYNQKFRYPPEVMLSRSFFERQPAEFFDFYRDKMLPRGAEPNEAHKKLAEWERTGKLLAVVTQNIDGLHQRAGSKNVFELHGSVCRNSCVRCGAFHRLEDVRDAQGVPLCGCGGVVKPDVVLYEEPLNEEVMVGAISAIMSADLLIVGGTSLSVYPAAGLIDSYRGSRLVLINRTATPKDARANLVFRESIGALLSKL